MNQFTFMVVVTTVAILGALAAIAALVGMKAGWPVGLIFFWVLAVIFFLQGLRKIPADPPMIGVPEFLGNYIATTDNGNCGGVSQQRGWKFYPLLGLLFDYDLLNGGQLNFELDLIEERTPDTSTVSVDPFFYYEVDRENPVAFIRAGHEEGVETRFAERVGGRIREWITSKSEGPLTWQEAIQSNGLAMDVIIQKLFPGKLPPIPDDVLRAVPSYADIPISTYVKYFTERPPLPEKIDTQNDPELKKVEFQAKQTLDTLKRDNRAAWDNLQKAVRARVDFIEAVKGGDCRFKIKNLGIAITLAGLGSIKASGSTRDAADKVAAQRQDAVLQKIKSDNFKEQVQDLLPTIGNDPKAAAEAVQLLRGLATKTIEEKQYALRGDNLQTLNQGLRDLFSLLERSSQQRADMLQRSIDAAIQLLQPITTATAKRIAPETHPNP